MQNKIPLKIAIIGGGAAGVTLSHYLVDNARLNNCNRQLQIDLFEPNQLGAGVAYQEDLDNLILNVHSQAMTIQNSPLKNFYDWYQAQNFSLEHHQYPPRYLFGKYLREVFVASQKIAKQNGMSLSHIRETIVDINKNKNYLVTTDRDRKIEYDFVILCVGNNSVADLYHLKNKAGYIHNPYPMKESLKEIPQHESIAILGSSLTAIDVATSLLKHHHKGSIHFYSRSGSFPSVRGKPVSHQMKFITQSSLNQLKKRKEKITIKDVIKMLRLELANINEDWRQIFTSFAVDSFPEFLEKEIHLAQSTRPWQAVLMATNEVVENYWHALAEKDKKLFLSKYNSFWMAKRAPIPILNARKIYQGVKQGIIQLKKGIHHIAPNHDGFLISSKQEQSQYQWIVNATGATHDIQLSGSALLNNLSQKGYIKKHSLGGIDVDFHTAAVINKENKVDMNFRAIGHITFGAYYYTSSFIMIDRKAQQVADDLIRSMCSEWKEVICF